jgi:hypothetical protein
MTPARTFRGFRFPAEVILWAARWYLQFPLSYRDLERMLAQGSRMRNRGLSGMGGSKTARPHRALRGASASKPQPVFAVLAQLP